jgi:hypothetical protein
LLLELNMFSRVGEMEYGYSRIVEHSEYPMRHYQPK